VSRNSLDRAVLEWIAEGALGPPDDVRFERLALELFGYQYEENAPYRRYCNAYGVEPGSVATWDAIPAVPTGAFKEARLATFPQERTVRTFRTSGSTTDRRGELHLDTLELYEASLLATFSCYVCPDGPIRFTVLAPSGTDAPDSSLSCMFDVAVARLGTDASRFYVHASGWEPDRLLDDLCAVREPVALVGTAFAFVHLLDFLSERGRDLTLPEGSRVMETGGFKGRSRDLSRDDLHGALVKFLDIPRSRIVNQYGMCELGSQFYEDSIRTGEPSTTKRSPPWVRTRVVDPETLQVVSEGATGILLHYDLVNTGSVLAVQTSDLGRAVDGGFEVLGRVPNAEIRGCSVAADLLLGNQ
jgi:hypothetical protein